VRVVTAPTAHRAHDLAFVLLTTPVAPDAGRVVAAARSYGLELVPDPDDPVEELDGTVTRSFAVAGGPGLVVALMPAPHPDAPQMPVGVTSPPYDQIAVSPAHLVLAAQGLPGTVRERDTLMAILTAALIDSVDSADSAAAVAAMLGHGAVCHRARLFADYARLAAQERSPLSVEVAVDITAAQESPTRMSFLTHGLRRYGREEFFVTCPIEGKGALAFVLSMARWVLADPDKSLPTGDTVGRTPDEKVVVQRVPDPRGTGPEVIRLDLP
jgi:hypothetical protein